MFNKEILNRLIDLNINSITKSAAFAIGRDLQSLRLMVDVPYYFLTIYDDSTLNQLLRRKGTVAYIKKNGITTLILYLPAQNIGTDEESANYKFTDNLTLSDSDKIEVWHKPRPKNPTSADTANLSIVEVLDVLTGKPSNVYYWHYAMAHPSFYLYQSVLDSDVRFKDFKYFRLYCTLLFIAEKSNVIKHNRHVCHITPAELSATLPKNYKYTKAKQDLANIPEGKKQYTKTYIKFLDTARTEGLIADYAQDDEYISITFSDSFLAPLGAPPYAKIPFYLMQEDITQHNYRFMMYFIMRQMRNNPAKPYYVKIRIKELLKIVGLGTHTNQELAAQRLSAYMAILANNGALAHPRIYTKADIRKNTLIQFRLYKFKAYSLIPTPEDEELQNIELDVEDTEEDYYSLDSEDEEDYDQED